MGIYYEEDRKLFRLETANTEYQMKVSDINVLQHVYYGKKTCGQDMSYQNVLIDRGFSGNPYESRTQRGCSLDLLPQEFTGCGVGDYRVSSLSLVSANGSRSCDLRYTGYTITEKKEPIPGLPSARENGDDVETLQIRMMDPLIGLCVELFYSVFAEKDVITRRVVFFNMGNRRIILEKASSMCIDFPYGDFNLVHFHGRHCVEREMERAAVTHDIRVVGSRRGMSSHQENPFVILCDKRATEDRGDCYGFMMVYSGNHKTEVEMNQAGSTRVVMGIQDENFSWNLNAGESFHAPEVLLSYSGNGFNALSRNYHHMIRENICDRKYRDVERPVLINNWEATYFGFDTDKIIHLAGEAAKLGIEMFVLDDGWFGKRDDDNSGLGDWYVNEKKLPGGLKKIADEVNRLGMKFGLWFEPEMINEDSDLFRAHPEWVLLDPERKPMMSRNQMVLDMGNPAVTDYLFDRMKKVLESANIEYVKWDFNRSMANLYSNVLPMDQQGEVSHRFILGTYGLLQRLLDQFPKLLIEGCSGGGGRFDAGMLYYCPQIWCSDDTDPVARLKIQHGTSYGYPVSTMGSHVSASPNHQTARVTSLNTRGVTAMSGTFGYELDLAKLTAEEKEIVRRQIADFHKYYWLIQKGDYYRLAQEERDSYYTAWEYVTQDQSEVLLNMVITDVQANPKIPCLKLYGLEESAIYRVEGTERTYTGAALMHGGYVIAEVLEMMFSEKETSSYPACQVHLVKC